MMSRATFLTLVSTLAYIATFGQTASLTGKALSENAPLPGVTITIPTLGAGTITNQEGKFEFKNLPEGTFQVHASYIGYVTKVDTITLELGTTKTLDISMQYDMLQLEGVVITGSRQLLKKHEAPVIVNSISNRTFETTQSLSISEGLSFSPGLRMETNCQNCGFNQLRMNGLEGTYTQILVNSRPIFSALAGVYGLEMLPANMVERIEVVRGGGSALYGGNAIGGTVNIITKDPMENSFEVGLNQSFTDLKRPDRTITLNGTVVSKDGKAGLALFGYNRDRTPWDANGDGFSELTKINNNTFGFDAFWNPTKSSKLKLGLYTIKEFRRGGNKFDLEPHQSDITEQLEHNILSTNISYELLSKNRKHRIAIYGSSQFVDRDSYYGAGGRVLTDSDTLLSTDDLLAINAYGTSSDVSAVGGLQYSFDKSESFTLTAGSEVQHNEVLDKMPGYQRSIDQQVQTFGNYLQLKVKPMHKLTLLLGGRYDYVLVDGAHSLNNFSLKQRNSYNVLVPRASVMYDINTSLKLRASYAQGYRAPQAFDEDLHIESIGGNVRFTQLSPQLVMERSHSFTASVNYGKTFKKTQLNLVAEGFYNQLNNPFILSGQTELDNGVAVITKRNGTGAVVQGINLETNMAWKTIFVIQSGATFQSATYDEVEEIWAPEEAGSNLPATRTRNILRTPNAYGYFTLQYTPKSAWAISYSGVLTGTMLAPHVIDPATEYTVIKTTPSFFENNVKINYNLPVKSELAVKLFAGVHNLFNSYQKDFDRGIDRDAGYIYGPVRPRTAYFGIKIGMK